MEIHVRRWQVDVQAGTREGAPGLASWWGITRMTSRPLSRIDKVATKASVKKVAHNGVTFLWSKDADPATYDTFRLPGEGDAWRDAQDLAPEEIALCQDSCRCVDLLRRED